MDAPQTIAVASIGVRAPGSLKQSAPIVVTDARRVQLRSEAFDIDIRPRPESDMGALARALNCKSLRFLVGDESQDGKGSAADSCTANLVVFEYERDASCIQVRASLVGLPPIYTAVDDHGVRLSAPFVVHEWLHEIPRALSPEAVLDHLCWGYPVSQRTVYDGIRLAPAGSMLVLRNGALSVHEDMSSTPEWSTTVDTKDLVKQELEAFDRSVRRMNVTGAFLCLSGGLDSRTILQALSANAIAVPCVTIASSERSLDCRNAMLASRAAGVPHEIAVLGLDYHRSLPTLFWEAARLTGGLGALAQTVDVYVYRQLNGRYARRISGNLGNQVARAGFERLSMPGLDPTILSDELRERATSPGRQSPWFVERMREHGVSKILFQEEIPFYSAANYSLGSAFATQLTPYADAELIRLSTIRNRHAINVRSRFFRARLRARDLTHRINGPPIQSSFQRQYINARVDRSDQTPVNFGWRPYGGMDSRRAALLTCVGLSMLASRVPGWQRLDSVLRHAGLHPRDYWGLSTWHSSFRASLGENILDLINSSTLAQSGLFNLNRLKQVVARYLQTGAGNSELVANILEIGAALQVSREIAEKWQRQERRGGPVPVRG